MKTKRPGVNLRCVADQYCDKSRERIVEFHDAETDLGGLISFTRRDDGRLIVNIYRCDSGVMLAMPGSCRLKNIGGVSYV